MVFIRAKWVVYESFSEKNPLNLRGREYIKYDNENHPIEYRNFHTLFRLKFNGENKGKYILKYSADDIAKVYINGTFIDLGPAPSYHFSYGYNQFDISEYIKEGVNVISAHLYYQGEINRVTPSGDFRTGFIAEVIKDENIIVAYTDKKTKCKKSMAYNSDNNNLLGYRTQYIEYFDANKWEYNWKNIQFDDSQWKYVGEKNNNDHNFVLQETKPLKIYNVIPKKVTTIDKNITLYDLGCEYAGVVCFKVKGKKGDVIEIRCAEELDENNRAKYDMRCNCKYLVTHTVSGDEKEQSEFFDYTAFRYFEISAPTTSKIENVKVKARNYPFDEKSTYFNSSENNLDQIWDICKNGVRTGTQEGYLDCPTREKGLYLGDMTITAQSHFYLTGDLSIYKRALRGFAQSTYFYKGINTTCLNHFIHPLVDYSFQFPLNLLFYYKHSGDKEFLKEMVPYCEMMFDFYEAHEKEGLLYDIEKEGHLVDWPRAPYDFTDGYDYNLNRGETKGTHNIVNAFHIGGRKNMNEIYDILGIPYEDKVPYLKRAYIEAFYDKKTHLFKDTIESNHSSLHSNIIPLYYGIEPKEARASILELIKEKRLHCGVYIAYFLLKGLCNLKEYDLVYDLITSDDLFSWSNMIKEGATTCFEIWGKDLKWNTSLCHPWASSPIILIVEDLLGISPKKPGWQKGYTIHPNIPEKLNLKGEIHVNKYKISFNINNKK